MIRAKPWNGKDLKGIWEFTLKIDGVRAFWTEDGWVSRNGKPLYNIPDSAVRGCSENGYEVYCSKPGRSSKNNYKATIECVRAKTKDRPVRVDELYALEPLDERLRFNITRLGSAYDNPTAAHIKACLKDAVAAGYEGLVLRQRDHWLKVKPVETYDVKVTGIIEGTGKHKGRMGALMTDMGKVGTGFTDAERITFWNWHLEVYENDMVQAPIVGMVIEVECMQLTPAGKFRHPRFVRIRYDK